MEAILVYCLVLIFFIALLVLSSTVLKNHPYSAPLAHQQAGSVQVDTSKPGGYIAVAIVLAVLFIASALRGKRQAQAT